MSTLKNIKLVHTSREEAEKEKNKLDVKTPVYIYEITGHDFETFYVIERYSTYAIGVLYSQHYKTQCNTLKYKNVTKEDLVEFMKKLSKEELAELMK